MAEIFDRLLIRILLAAFICLMLYLYRYLHLIFYPTVRKQVLNINNPSENPADTMHLYSRLVGIGIIFSSITLNESSGFFLSIFHFLVWGVLSIALYLLSLYIIESIVFHHFDYTDEILKRKNMSYGFISMCNALVVSHLTRVVMIEAENSIIILAILWPYILVITGVAIRFYGLISKLSFNRLMVQQNMSLSFSYAGFIAGAGILIAACFDQEHHDIGIFLIQVLLKTILALLLFPLFKEGLTKIFPIRLTQGQIDAERQQIGYGIWEGCLFLTSAILTSMLVNRIQFGTIYPFF